MHYQKIIADRSPIFHQRTKVFLCLILLLISPLFKSFYHQHSFDDIKYRNLPLDFRRRYKQAFGCIREGVYSQTMKGRIRDYRTKWILLEDAQENKKRFCWVFHDLNILLSLSYYREKQVAEDCFVDLAFDFDSPELEKARTDTLKMVNFLRAKVIPYHLFFSGKKGFHIVIGYQVFGQEYQKNNHLINKEIVKIILEETGSLSTLDMAIYISKRLLRVANTIHSGSGLFKVPITYEELSSGMDIILKLAKKKRDNFPLIDRWNGHDYLNHVYLQAKQNLARLPKYDVPDIDLGILEGSLPPCIDECLKVGIKPEANANRNETTMLLASYFKGVGLDMQLTKERLVHHALTVLKRFSSSSDREIINSTNSCITTVYRNSNYKFNCQFARGKFRLLCDDTCKLYRKYRDNHSSRKLHYMDVEQPKPQHTYTVEEIRVGIREQIDNYLATPQGRIFLIEVFAGVGKTLTTIMHLTFGHGRIIWVASRVELFENIPYDCSFKWKQIYGRHSGIKDKNGNLLVPANCQHAKLAHALGNKNHDIMKRLCHEYCDVKIRDCEYFRQFHDREHHWFVQQPLFFFTEDNFLEPFDLVVIDEDVMDCFKKEIKVTSADIRENYKLLSSANDLNKVIQRKLASNNSTRPAENDCTNGNLDSVLKLLQITGLVTKTDIPFGSHETGRLILDKFETITKEKYDTDIREILKSITDSEIFDKEVDFELNDPSKIPLNFIKYLHEVLCYEFLQKHPKNNLSRLFFQKKHKKTNKGSVCLETLMLLSKLEKNTDKPIIILDATGKKRIYEKLFDREVIEYAPQIKLENEIIQIYSSSNSKQSLQNDDHFKRNMEAVKKLVSNEPHTLVVCKAAFEEKVAEQLPDSVRVVHFYGLRGSNDHKDFRQVIILGTPQNREEEIKKFAGILYFDETRPVDTSVDHQFQPYMALAKDGRAPAVKIRMFRDPLLQDINEIYREDEIIQAINRIRIVHDFKKLVVILSNIPLPGLPITDLLDLRDLTGNYFARRQIKTACQFFLDKFGFIQRKNFIDHNFDSQLMQHPELLEALKEHEIWFPVSNGYTERTITTHFRPIVNEMGLRNFKVKYMDLRGHGFLEIWGKDESSLDKAKLLLSNIRNDMMFY